VTHADNVPEGCLLSLCAGGARRQAPLVPRQKGAFSGQSAAAAVASGGSGIKVDILSVQGSARISAQELGPGFGVGTEEAAIVPAGTRGCNLCRWLWRQRFGTSSRTGWPGFVHGADVCGTECQAHGCSWP
jgi:hypothetical protein